MILSRARTSMAWVRRRSDHRIASAPFLRPLSSLSTSPPSLLFRDDNRHTAFNVNNGKAQEIVPLHSFQRFLSTPTSPTDAVGHGAENHLSNPESEYYKYIQPWSLTTLASVDKIMREDDPENDLQVSKIMVDFMKRLEINSDRLADLQQRVEDFHARLRTTQSNNEHDSDIQETMHMLETERKTLRNLQMLHLDTWKSAKAQYLQWSPDGDDDIDNDDDCPNPIIILNPKKRKARWHAMVGAATEIQARHAMTIEQMSELVIRLKVLKLDPEFEVELNAIYDVVCAFLRCRMTQQLLCQHLVAMGKDALGTSIAKKIEAKRKELAIKEGLDPAEVEASNGRVVGAINLESPVSAIVRSSMTEASQLCEATYLVSPPVAFVLAWDAIPFTEDVRDTTNAIYENVSATFVRSWLQYTLIELLKNAMVATVESNLEIAKRALEEDFSDSASECMETLPSLFIDVYNDEEGENVIIQIHDQGGGIKDEFDLESLFEFGQRETVWDRMDEQQTYSRK